MNHFKHAAFRVAYPWSLCRNDDVIHKPEVHNVSQSEKARATGTVIMHWKFGEVWTSGFLDMLIAIFRILTGGSNKLHRQRSETINSHTRLVIEIPILGYLGVCGYFWVYLGTSGAKSDVIFILSDPDFLQRGRNFAPTEI